MVSKTKQSGRAEVLLRMEPELKARISKAVNHHGLSVTDWLLDVIEDALTAYDAEVAARERKADLEHRLETKFEEIVAALAGGEFAALSKDKIIELHYVAEAAIKKWQDRTASDYYAQPQTPIERLAKQYCLLEDEIEGSTVKAIDTSFEIQIDDADPDDDELDDARDDGE